MVSTGLCYQRCIWRCNIKRLINQNDINDYLFLAETTTYGNTTQSAITYHKQLLKVLNDWVYKLNQTIFKKFKDTEFIKTYCFEYKMFSDIFYLDKSKRYTLTLYNTKLLQRTVSKLTQK